MGLTVLPPAQRLTRPDQFRAAGRQGRRAGSRTVVTHLLVPEGEQVVGVPAHEPARVGFVVGKAVGSAVTRNRVKRRLRHAARERVAELPQGSLLVVRALPTAALASYEELAGDLDRCLRRAGRGSREA